MAKPPINDCAYCGKSGYWKLRPLGIATAEKLPFCPEGCYEKYKSAALRAERTLQEHLASK